MMPSARGRKMVVMALDCMEVGRAWGQESSAANIAEPGGSEALGMGGAREGRTHAAKRVGLKSWRAGLKAKRAGLKSWRLSGTDSRVNRYAAILAPVYTATGRALDILDSVAERALAVQ